MKEQRSGVSARGVVDLDSGWLARASTDVSATGDQIASAGFDTTGWLDAAVPGTVLGTLLANDVVPDPFFGTNNTLIPDLSDASDAYTWWFRTTFPSPAVAPGGRVWLDLNGVNYTATLYLNGATLPIGYTTPPVDTTANGAPLAANAVQGMFQRQRIDITDQLAAGTNVLAVLVEPPDPAGTPGGNGGTTPNIANSVTMRYGVGWDWVQSVPDRSTGLWDRVELVTTGAIRLEAPQVITTVLDASGHLEADATVTAAVDVRNPGPATTVTVTWTLVETGQTTQQTIQVPASAVATTATVSFTVDSPQLWWPRRLGSQPMYALAVTASIGGTQVDDLTVPFGIREVGDEWVDLPDFGKARRFSVNGQPMFLRGGNWIGTDAMLRAENLSAERYLAELRLLADAGLDLIRVWGGGIAERDAFYEAADQLGLLVMQDFWISGEYNYGYPPGYDDRFLACAGDTIRRLRNHPSLLFWSAGNEAVPPPPILDGLQIMISAGGLDPTRLLVDKSTSIGWDGAPQYDDGPYGIQLPSSFFTGSTLKSNPFNPELGSVGTPVADDLPNFMSSGDAAAFPSVDASPSGGGLNPTWKQHTYIPYFNDGNSVPNQMCPWGYPTDTADFCFLAQILQYEQYRSLFEGYTSGMWDRYTGVLLWKVQNPWPGLRGLLHDWDLGQTGGHYGTRSALQPLTVQYDPSAQQLAVVNTTGASIDGLTVAATAVAMDGSVVSSKTFAIGTVDSPAVSAPVDLTPPANPPSVYVLRLVLSDASGTRADKRYWLSPTNDFTSLRTLARAAVSGSVTTSVIDGEQQFTAQLRNTGTVCAMWVRLTLRSAPPSATADTRVLPAFDEDNYVILLPGESRSLTLRCASGAAATVWMDGWNVDPVAIGP